MPFGFCLSFPLCDLQVPFYDDPDPAFAATCPDNSSGPPTRESLVILHYLPSVGEWIPAVPTFRQTLPINGQLVLIPHPRFNSSGATIVPDVSERNRRVLQQANDVSTLSSARVLMPQDTLGRELDAALTEDEGQTAAPPVTGSVDWQALGIDDFDFQSASLDQGNPDFASLLQAHTQLPPELIAGLQIGNDTHSPSFRHSASPFNSHSALAVENMVNPAHPGQQYHSHFAQAGGEIDAFRPSSAHSHHSVHSHHSHHSSISASDYSYTSTEVSMDEDVRMDAPDDVLWGLIGGAGKRQDEGVNPAELLGGGKRDIGAVAAGTYPTPGNSAGGPSPPTAIGGMFGPIRGVQETVIEAPGQKQDRLERESTTCYLAVLRPR